MSIGDNLRAIRNRNNISQQEIADYLGIDRKTYVSWESGKADIKSSYLPKLAEFLCIEISDLFKEKSSTVVVNRQTSNNEDRLISGFMLLLTDKEAVDQLVEVVKKRFDTP